MESPDDSKIGLVRELLSPSINQYVNNSDCKRFLKARKGDINAAVKMITNWYDWRHTQLPGYEEGVTPENIIQAINRNGFMERPSYSVCRYAQHGEDKEGRPIYWEKTGFISANFHKIKKEWTLDELLGYHIKTMELLQIRMQHCSRKYGKEISQCVIVFDLTGLNLIPDMMGINYSRKVLGSDQTYYPERLSKMFIINAPVFFTGIWALVSNFIDPVTALKIQIIGADYLPKLLEYIDVSHIPVENGGTCELPWSGPWSEESGISSAQLDAYFRNKSEGAEVRQAENSTKMVEPVE